VSERILYAWTGTGWLKHIIAITFPCTFSYISLCGIRANHVVIIVNLCIPLSIRYTLLVISNHACSYHENRTQRPPI